MRSQLQKLKYHIITREKISLTNKKDYKENNIFK